MNVSTKLFFFLLSISTIYGQYNDWSEYYDSCDHLSCYSSNSSKQPTPNKKPSTNSNTSQESSIETSDDSLPLNTTNLNSKNPTDPNYSTFEAEPEAKAEAKAKAEAEAMRNDKSINNSKSWYYIAILMILINIFFLVCFGIQLMYYFKR